MYNLTGLTQATSFFDIGTFVHSVLPSFFVLFLLAVWVVVTAIGSSRGFKGASLIASFVCASLTLPLVLAGFISIWFSLGFWILTGIIGLAIKVYG